MADFHFGLKSTSQQVNESTSQRVNKSTSQQVNEYSVFFHHGGMKLLVDPLTCRLVDFYSDFFSEKYLKVGIEKLVNLLLFCTLENWA